MNDFTTSVALWLADNFLLGSVLLFLALAILAALKQPAQRLAVTKSTLVALFLLAVLCALPGWSVVHLLSPQKSEQPRANGSPVVVNDAEASIERAPIAKAPSEIVDKPQLAAHIASPPPRAPFWIAISWLTVVATTYAVGSMCVLGWLALGSLAARRLVNTATPAPAQLIDLMRAFTGSKRPQVCLLLSRKIDVAVAIGIRRPAILLPHSLTESFSPLATGYPLGGSPLGSVLAHELAHITNHDLHWLAASRALLVLLWPQPLFWLLRRRMRLDQEALADAAAAEITTRQTYAELLVAWARNLPPHPAPRLSAAVGLWEGPSQLRQRIALLLDEHFTVIRNSSRRLRLSALALAIASALALSTVTLQPSHHAAAQPAAPVATDKATSPPSTLTTPAGEIPRPIPNAVLGRAMDESGRPIAGAEVFLFRVNRHDFARKILAQKTTDADGRFRFDNVIDIAKEFPGGNIPPRDALGDEFIQTIIRVTRKVSDVRTHVPQDIARHGDVPWARMQPAATLRGRVTGPDGIPIAGALVSASGAMIGPWEGIQSARTDADGNYTITDIAPFDMAKFREQQEAQRREAQRANRAGNQADALFFAPPVLTVEHPDFAMKRTAYEKIPGTKDVQLDPPAILEGRVVFGDSRQPAAGVLVQAVTSNSSGRLPPMDAVYSRYGASARTDAEGRYRFATLPAGTYDLWAEGGMSRQWKLPAAAGAYDVWAKPGGWVNQGVKELAATSKTTTAVPDLKLVKGVLLRIRLVDKKTGKPVTLQPDTIPMLVVSPRAFPSTRPVFEKVIAPGQDGRLEVRTFPGENQITAVPARSGDGPKWFGTTIIGADPPRQGIGDRDTIDVDLPVADEKDAESRAAKADVIQLGDVHVNPFLRPREAVDAFTKRLKDQPDNPDLLLARSEAFQRLGEYAKAIADLEQLLRQEPPPPQNFIARNNLAALLSTAPDDSIRDGKRAVELALRAQQLAQQLFSERAPAEVLDTLAAAYAETGDFDQAVKTQQKAIELVPANEEFRKHLELYRAKQPLRQARPDAGKPADNDNGAANQPVDIPIIVAKHVLLHDGKIIEWADVERLVTNLPNPRLARPGFYFTPGARPERQEEIRTKISDLRRRQPMAGHSWSSISPRTAIRYDAVRTAADLVPNKDWLVTGAVETADGLPIDGAEVVLAATVDESIPYKTVDLYLRNERLRNPLDEVVTASDNSGRFAVYPPPDTPYYLIALHKEGFGLVRSDDFAKSGRVTIQPWAHIRGKVKSDARFQQTASVTLGVPAVEKWPELEFHFYSEDLGPPSPDGRFEFKFIPPQVRGVLRRSVKGEQGSSYSIPIKELKLAPSESLEADIDPPTDADVKQIELIKSLSK